MIGRPLRIAVLLLLGLLLRVTSSAAAEPPDERLVQLMWDAPAECPTGESIEREVARIARASSRRPLRAGASVTRSDDGVWTLRLSTESGGRIDARVLVGASCAELASALAVVLAIDLAPLPGETTSTPPAVAPTPSPPREPSDVSVPVRPRGDEVALAGSALLSAGVLGTPAIGGAIGLVWFRSRVRIEADGMWFPPTHDAGDARGTGGTFQLYGGDLVGCWTPFGDRVRAGACAGAQAGALHANSSGAAVDTSTPGSSFWLALRGGAVTTFRIDPRLGLRASLDLLVPLTHDSFSVANVGEVHTVSPVAGQLSLGMELHFP